MAKEIFTLLKYANGSYTILLQTDHNLTEQEALSKRDYFNQCIDKRDD